MHKARLPHKAYLDEAVQKLASSPCGMSESDPAYFGYWSKEEVLNFLLPSGGRLTSVLQTWFLSLNLPRERFVFS